MELIDYKKRFKALRKRLVLLFIITGSVLITTLVAINFRISFLIRKKEDISALINISGRQRMLSQSMAKMALLIEDTKGEDAAKLTASLDSLSLLFTSSHEHLKKQNLSLHAPELKEKFQQIQPHFEGLLEVSSVFISGTWTKESIHQLIYLESAFIPIMDAIVKDYEILSVAGYEAINRSVRLLNLSIILLILISCIVAYFAAIRIVRTYAWELAKRSEELRATTSELERTKLREHFSYVASHDLREPVSTIISLTELLKKEHAASLNADGKQMVEFISESSLRMSRLIKGLLDISRVGKNQAVEVIDLNETIQTISRDLSALIEQKNALLSYPDLPNIVGYRIDIHSLFQNLIGNAIKFSRPSVDPKVEISYTEDAVSWYFEVKDNGIGIEKKDTERIFQLFKRLHKRREYDGVGIGLAHCSRIVEIHRGSISVNSEVGEGSTFRFSISKDLEENLSDEQSIDMKLKGTEATSAR